MSMSRAQAGILVIAAFLTGLHSRSAAQQPSTGPQTIEQSDANPLRLNPDTVNVLKADVAARSASLKESAPKGFWIQNWNDPQQTFAWKVQAPQAGEYSVEVLASGAPGSKIEIASPQGGISVIIPEGNDHWGITGTRFPLMAG